MIQRKIFTLTAILLIPFTLLACSCMPMTKEDYINQADLAVIATLVDVGSYLKKDDRRSLLPFHFKVDKWLKGTSADNITVFSRNGSSACGIDSKMNYQFTLYLQKEFPFEVKMPPSLNHNELYYTDRCKGSVYLLNERNRELGKTETKNRKYIFWIGGIIFIIAMIGYVYRRVVIGRNIKS